VDENIVYSAEQAREIGKVYLFNSDGDPQKKEFGLKLLFRAQRQKDPEATYIISRLLLDGIITASVENQTEYALTQMCASANSGCIQARAFLNVYCKRQYEKNHMFNRLKRNGALVDFEGKPIKINRQGVLTPIDALLEYKNGQNILTLSVNVAFSYFNEMENTEQFEAAVRKGLLRWQGEYEVFGGQKVIVKVNITNKPNLFDNLYIIPVTDEYGNAIQKMSSIISTKEKSKRFSDIIKKKRSFALSGFKWSVKSRKFIFMQSDDGKFNNYYEIEHVAKHEFGHALGLGDLYASKADSLDGVSLGTYSELDSYAISDKYYNLVMCDHYGPISNNDIEMVILAFSKNKIQLYQRSKIKDKISSALGRGN